MRTRHRSWGRGRVVGCCRRPSKNPALTREGAAGQSGGPISPFGARLVSGRSSPAGAGWAQGYTASAVGYCFISTIFLIDRRFGKASQKGRRQGCADGRRSSCWTSSESSGLHVFSRVCPQPCRTTARALEGVRAPAGPPTEGASVAVRRWLPSVLSPICPAVR